MSTPQVKVNGTTAPLGAASPHTTALDWLRDLGWTGAKEGCAEGECGACAIMVARPDTTGPDTTGAETTEWVAINSCLVPAAGLDGQEVLTAEGLGTPTSLHPVQHEMAVRGGSQCGYCTPGFICSMAAEYYRAGRVQDPDQPGAEADAEHGPNGFDLHAMSGNLCRCTGYRPIRDAAFALGRAGRRRRPRSPPRRAAARTGRHPDRLRRRGVRATGRPGRGPADPRGAPGRGRPSPGAPTGASRSTSVAPAHRWWSRSTGSPSCATSASGPTRSGSVPRSP